jgi:hypothetical protein
MKTFRIRISCVLVLLATLAPAQDVIPLYSSAAPGSTEGNYPEKEYFSKTWNTEVVSNVTKPTLTVFKPAPELKSGTAVVICPGAGFMALSIKSEGTDVANYLVAKGVTAFVLKYRLLHTGEDAPQEFMDLIRDRSKFDEKVASVIHWLLPMAWLRSHTSASTHPSLASLRIASALSVSPRAGQ